MSFRILKKLFCKTGILICLIANNGQSYADIGVCEFGQNGVNFYEPHNCQNGDTAIWRRSKPFFNHLPPFFIAQNCRIDGKIIEGISTDDFGDLVYIICEFQKKVER